MSELILQWIWRKQVYDPASLYTTTGEKVEIISPGLPYPFGPDFEGAQVRINGLLHVGSVEIDLYPSLWYAHAHHLNPLYERVILHVVWKASRENCTYDKGGRVIPILALSSAVNESAIQRLSPKQVTFPCAAIARTLSESVWTAVYEEWAEQRLHERCQSYQNEGEFLQGFWSALLRGIGAPQGDSFQRIAKALPWTILKRHAPTLLSKEAALMGTAGLLESVGAPSDPYEKELLSAWRFLQRKFGWTPLQLHWHPTRPPLSPWRKLAQLAALVHNYSELAELFYHPPLKLPPLSPYWQSHWAWQRPLSRPLMHSSPLLLHNLLVNAIYPFGIYYFQVTGQAEAALQMRERFRRLPPENHRYARLYATYAYVAQNAWQTQGQIQLWRQGCEKQRCLTCRIGRLLLQQ